jgi:DNA-binding ferritin-like protein (Dps family)
MYFCVEITKSEKIMEEQENKDRQDEIFSKAVRAGKRTYFFDVKATRSNEYYITITESKRKFNNDQGKFFYEKHKLFLYKEDFEKFQNGLKDVIEFIETGKIPEIPVDEIVNTNESAFPEESVNDLSKKHTQVEFEDLDSEVQDK